MFRPFPPRKGREREGISGCVHASKGSRCLRSRVISHLISILGRRKTVSEIGSALYLPEFGRQAGRQGKQTKQASRHPQSLISSQHLDPVTITITITNIIGRTKQARDGRDGKNKSERKKKRSEREGNRGNFYFFSLWFG